MATAWRCSVPERITRILSCRCLETNDVEKGPELIGEVLSRLFLARGWGRKQERLRLEQAWADAVGSEGAEQTRVHGIRRGALEVVVGNSGFLQELAHYQQRRLLEKTRSTP